MKKRWIAGCFAAVILGTMCVQAEEDTIIIGDNNTPVLKLDEWNEVEGIVELRPTAAKVSETLGEYGEKSDDKNSFVIVDIDVCNISYDTILLDELLSAELTYNDSYHFTQYKGSEINSRDEMLLGEWAGIECRSEGYRVWNVEFTEVDDDGNVYAAIHVLPYDGECSSNETGSYTISGKYNPYYERYEMHGKDWIENPNGWMFFKEYYFEYCSYDVLAGRADSRFFYLERTSSAEMDSELDMLEESIYQLVFKCPTRVIENLSECTLTVQIGEELWQIPLQ